MMKPGELRAMDLQFMDFEARTKKQTSDMLEPIINKAFEDGNNILRLTSQAKKTEERLRQLEAAVL
jgi:hypothetical protein